MKYFLLFSFIIIFVFSIVIHPFEVPDENSHFSSLIFLSNEGRMPNILDSNNLTLEEYEAEKVFGIVEHENKYSFHPEFRVEQVAGLEGKGESKIKSLNTSENRRNYYSFQAATYPPLYYLITLPFYRFVYEADILTRLFFSRFSSVIITLFVILVAYKVGLLVFKNRNFGYTLALMTLFFPMTTYVGAGISSDNLHNLLFGIATYFSLRAIESGFSKYTAFILGIVVGLDLITKPQGYILFPIIALAIIVRWEWKDWRSIFSSLFYLLTPIILLAGWQELPKFILGNSNVGVTSYTARAIEYGGIDNFKIFIEAYIKTTLSEMIVWYWGVFKWFGVIMPKPWWWIANRLVGLSVIGILLGLVKDLKNHQYSWHSKVALFGIGANFIYVASICWFDWQFYQEYGRSLGLQARYYMPLLISQMCLFLLGLTNLGWNDKIKEFIRKGMIVFFLGLQLTSFYVQISSYYDLQPIRTLIEQISQYKPFYAKGDWWYLWFPAYFAGIITTTLIALRSDSKA